MMEELKLVAGMLKAAAPYLLETEVVWSFYNSAVKGNTVEESVAYALSEWDLVFPETAEQEKG